jgi:hypothetical protein
MFQTRASARSSLNQWNLSAKSSAAPTDLFSRALRCSEGSKRRQTTPLCRVLEQPKKIFDAGSTDSSANPVDCEFCVFLPSFRHNPNEPLPAKRRARPLQHSAAQLSTAQHNTTQHNTTQLNTTQHSSTPHNTTQHNTAQHTSTQHSTTQHNTAQHSTPQHNTAQHSTTQHSTAQHNNTTLNTFC